MEVTPSRIYISVIFGAMLILGFGIIQADLYANYGMSPNDLGYLDASSSVIEKTGELKQNIENTQITGIQPLDSFIAGTYNTLKLFFGVGDVYGSFVTDAARVLQIPGEFVVLIGAAISITLVFMTIRIITNKTRGEV